MTPTSSTASWRHVAETKRASRRREALQAEHDFLVASLSDLESEYRAGDLAEDDYTELRAGYVDRAATTLASIREAEVAAAAPSVACASGIARFRRSLGRRRNRRLLLAVLGLCVIGLACIVALSLAGVRLPGQSATGTVNLPANETISDELAEASLLGQEGQFSEAITVYQAVLDRSPTQPVALTGRAWLIRLVGIAGNSKSDVQSGDDALTEAVATDPGYAPARAYLGLALVEDRHDTAAALQQFQAFLADKPTSTFVQSIAPEIEKAYRTAHVVLPPSLQRELQTGRAAHS